jgi:hypothetical protein
MNLAALLPLAGGLIKGLGGALGSGESDLEKAQREALLADTQWKKYARGRAKGMEPSLLQGLTDADLARVSSYLRKASMPFINRAAGAAAGRFGSRSGRVQGAMANAIGQSYAQPLANFAAEIPQINLANRRYLHQAYST